MIVWLLVGCLFILMFLRIGLPFGVRTEGNVSVKVALTFRERLLLHRTNMYALGAILVLSAIGQWFPTTIEIVLILVALSIINLPISYLFSSQGIACNNVLFRSWKEFAYVSVRGAQLTLVPRKGFAPLRLVVLPSRQKEVLPHFRRFLEIRQDTSPYVFVPLAFVRNLWKRISWRTVVLFALLMTFSLFLLTACGAGPDPSGLNSANQQNLTSVTANGTTTISKPDLTKAQKNEPFAYNLAILVDENRLGINLLRTPVIPWV